MKELVTINSILNFFKEIVEKKQIFSPSVWIDAAAKLNALLGDETDLLYQFQKQIAQEKEKLLKANIKETVSSAKVKVEATDLYENMQRQRALIGRIEEFIRIAKIQAKLKDNEQRIT